MASKFIRFESSWLQHVGNTAKEGVQDAHHFSGRTETATENGTGQAASHHHYSSHFWVSASVASSIVPDQWCMFCTPSLAVFRTRCNLIRIWRPQLRWNNLISGVYFLNNLIVACAWWAFPVSQGSVETSFRWGGICSYDFAENLLNYPPNFIRIVWVLYEILQKKHFGLFFPRTQCIYMFNWITLRLCKLPCSIFAVVSLLTATLITSYRSYIALIINSYFYLSFHFFIIFTLIFTISYIIRFSYFILAK